MIPTFKRGTTPTIPIRIPGIDIQDIRRIDFIIRQRRFLCDSCEGESVLKSWPREVEYENGIFYFPLTDSETRLFYQDSIVYLDVKPVTLNGKILGTKIKALDVYPTLFCSSEYPYSGDKVKIDLDGDGVKESYLVLNAEGSVAELLALYAPENGKNIPFDIEGETNIYDTSNIDTYLNTTFYNSLSDNAKQAIVEKTFFQDSWYSGPTGSPDYIGTYHNSTEYVISLGTHTYQSEIKRKVYTLSVQDIIDYLGVTPDMTAENTLLNRSRIQTMFATTSENIWTRSADASGDDYVMFIQTQTGRIWTLASYAEFNVRPVMKIDLSKVEWR